MVNTVIEKDMRFITEADLQWDEFKNKTVLITGASGLIPSYMLRTLIYLNEKGFNIKIYALVRNEVRAQEIFKDYLNNPYFTLLVQDVCEPIKITENIDYIIHGASKASPKHFKIDPAGVLKANTIGTYNCLELAREKKVKGFLFFSSGAVYGNVEPEQIPIKEDCYGMIDPLNVSSCYGESKKVAETMCATWYYQHEVPTKIVRPYHVYGPGLDLEDGRVFADFVKNILDENDIILKSKGNDTRSFCYLADATRGFFTVLLKGENANAYNIGDTNCEISIKDLAELLVKIFPEKNLKVVQNIDNSQYLRIMTPSRGCADTQKVLSLGWKPLINIEEGFKRTIKSFI